MKKNFTFYILTILSCNIHLFCMEPIKASDFAKASSDRSAGRQAIIYAPWREHYVNAHNPHQNPEQIFHRPCIFCRIVTEKNDTKNFILHRGKHSLIMLASIPYIDNGIHFLIVPYEHKKELCDLSSETYHEENLFTQKLCARFSSHANETYINSNQGSAAGASIPEHNHKHIIVNYAPIFYNLIDAIRETRRNINLQSLYERLQPCMSSLETIDLPQKQVNKLHTDCYYCSVIQPNFQENLIIHRGKYVTIMLSHYPTYFGEIDIVPNEHIESLETMPVEVYEEINKATVEIYPLMLKIMNAQDSNIGLVSYGDKATHGEHIRQKLIPRKDSWNRSPITRSNHISGDIKKFYRKLSSEWYALQHKAKL